jgi:putative inorganic carbon (HCO3(-)) transporter
MSELTSLRVRVPRKLMAKGFHFALCLVVGVVGGLIVLLNLPLKWQIAFLAALGTVILVLVSGSSKRILLFVLVSTLPIYFGKALVVGQAHFSLTGGASIMSTDVLGLMLCVVLLAKSARREAEIRLFPSVVTPALVWMIASSVSLLSATNGQLVMFQLLSMGKMVLLCWIVANSVENRGDVAVVMAGLMLGMLFQTLVGIYQGVTGRPIGLEFLTETAAVQKQVLGEGLVNRVQGTLGHPNSYATYLSTVMPFPLAWLFATKRPLFKGLTAILVCLWGVAVVFSLSRSAWVTLPVIMVIVLGLAARCKRISLKTAILIAALIALVLSALIFLGPQIILSRLTSDDQGSARARISLAQTALAIFEDHPWVGVGFNNYMQVSPQYDARAFVGQMAYVVHNAFLLIAAETGVVGLLAFVGFLTVLLLQTWRAVGRAANDTVWVAGVGAFSAFVALAMHSMTDYALLGSIQVFTQFWLLVGLSAALARCVDEQRGPSASFFGNHGSRPLPIPESHT